MYPLHPEGDNDSLVNNIEIENEHEDMKDAEYIAIGVGTLIILALLCYIFVILVKIRKSKNSPSIFSWISEEILHLVSFIKFNHKMSTTIESENRYEKLFRKKSGSCIFLDYHADYIKVKNHALLERFCLTECLPLKYQKILPLYISLTPNQLLRLMGYVDLIFPL